ncbi:1-phosphofructokinase family hexose kinase [Corynebacterium sp. TAE3-ERU30]|uniref:1-phosphofructokinase family hexose kinase n=1 Tax=Corynebacterium sp. TAE3-ERU30 TaxID=2849496 RepID=UPI001C475BCD|nr:1-phosphofructokinase family hexose kinase [Corynebacterium sp. TAE3-ERU30]MBV7281066.1 1-phosphofructokinase family hexose kinase [Corynebacterium sp. TAE3-ERU30]
MILCVTPTPVLQRAARISSPIAPGEVNHFNDVGITAGGTGTNVAYALYLAGQSALALFPAPQISHYMRLITEMGLAHDYIEVPGPIPMHSAVIESDLTTTEFRDPPMPLDSHQLAMLRDKTVAAAEHHQSVLLTGPLPIVATHGWYSDVLRSLCLYHPNKKVSIASTGPALQAVLRQVGTIAPHSVMCHLEDIATWARSDVEELRSHILAEPESSASELARTCQPLLDAGIHTLLIGIDRRHSLLLTESMSALGRYTGTPGYMSIPWRDSLVAGFQLGVCEDAPCAEQLRLAVAFGAAEGDSLHSFMPTKDGARCDQVEIIPL